MSFQISFFIRFFFVRFTSLAKLFWRRKKYPSHTNEGSASHAMRCLRLSLFIFYAPTFPINHFGYVLRIITTVAAVVVGRHRRRDRFNLSKITVHVCVRMSVWMIMYVSMPMSVDPCLCVCMIYFSYLRMRYTQLRAFILHFNSFCVENSLFAFKSHYDFNFNFQRVFSHNNSCFSFLSLSLAPEWNRVEWYDLQKENANLNMSIASPHTDRDEMR